MAGLLSAETIERIIRENNPDGGFESFLLQEYLFYTQGCPVGHITDDERNRLLERFDENVANYGRHFLNVFKSNQFMKLIEVGISRPDDDNYLVPISAETERQRFLELTEKGDSRLDFIKYDRFLCDSTRNLKTAKEAAEKYNQVVLKDDWQRWYDEIKERCEDLGNIYGGFFRNCLTEFLHPAHLRVVERYSADEVQRKMKRNRNRNEDGWDRAWTESMNILESYEMRPYVGFMLPIVDYWLNHLDFLMDRLVPDSVASVIPPETSDQFWMRMKALDLRNPEKKETKPFPMKPLPNNGGFSKFVPRKTTLPYW